MYIFQWEQIVNLTNKPQRNHFGDRSTNDLLR